MEEFDFFAKPAEKRDKIMTMILKFLPLDDIKSCKLVNRKWYSWCKQDSIFNKGVLVFRYNVRPVAEVNRFLTNLCVTRLRVKFIAMNLDKIDFENYGSKIRHLTIMNCSISNKEVLKNMFVNTPNMNCVEFFSFDQKEYLDEMLTDVFKALRRGRKFRNGNLESIESDTAINPKMTYKIFPSLKKFYWEPDATFRGHFDVQLRDRLEEIRNLSVDLDKLNYSKIEPVPKLKTLIGVVNFSPRPADFRNKIRAPHAFIKFFSALPSLETLELRVNFHLRPKDKEGSDHTNWTAKTLLCTIIEKCVKLRSFDMSIYERCSDGTIYRMVPVKDLDLEESFTFCRFIHRLERFKITDIDCDMPLYEMDQPKLKYLHLYGLPRTNSNDLRNLISRSYFCRTAIECLTLQVDHEMREDHRNNSMIFAFQYMLDFVKNLRRLRIHFCSFPTDTEPQRYEKDFDQFVLRHKKLEHFEMEFESFKELVFFNTTYDVKFSFEFPNLSTFHLEHGQTHSFETSSNSRDESSSEYHDDASLQNYKEFRSQLLNAIKNMPEGLKNIKLPDKRYSSMSIEEIVEMCKGKPKLKFLEWSSLVNPSGRTMKDIFEVLCPRLSKAIVHIYYEPTDPLKYRTVQYYYSRCEGTLYEGELKKINGTYRPLLFRLIQTDA